MPVVRMGNSLRDGEAESGTASVPAGVDVGWRCSPVHEALEEPVTERQPHAGALVLHLDVHQLIGDVDAHGHGASRWRMLERIVEQVQ